MVLLKRGPGSRCRSCPCWSSFCSPAAARRVPFRLCFEYWERRPRPRHGREGTLALLYLGIVGGALMYLLINVSIDILGASRAGTLIYTQMISVALFAWLILGESLAWYHLVGAALVITGILLVTLMRPKPPAGAAA